MSIDTKSSPAESPDEREINSTVFSGEKLLNLTKSSAILTSIYAHLVETAKFVEQGRQSFKLPLANQLYQWIGKNVSPEIQNMVGNGHFVVSQLPFLVGGIAALGAMEEMAPAIDDYYDNEPDKHAPTLRKIRHGLGYAYITGIMIAMTDIELYQVIPNILEKIVNIKISAGVPVISDLIFGYLGVIAGASILDSLNKFYDVRTSRSMDAAIESSDQ